MFTTLRPGQDERTLLPVEQSNRLPTSKQGPPHNACCECRTKKLKCTGEKTGCSRCLAQNKVCVYASPRPPKRGGTHQRRATVGSQSTTRTGSSSSAASSGASPSESTTTATTASTTTNTSTTTRPPPDFGIFPVKSWDNNGRDRLPLVPPPHPKPLDLHQIGISDWPMSASLSGVTDDMLGFGPPQTSIEDEDAFSAIPSAASTLSFPLSSGHMGHGSSLTSPLMSDVMDFDSLFATPPGLHSVVPEETYHIREEPSSMSHTPMSTTSPMTESRTVTQNNRHSSISKAPRRSQARSYTPVTNRLPDHRGSRDGSYIGHELVTPPETIQASPASQTEPHSCSASAQRLLERAHNSPRGRAHANELFRFLGDFKRVVQSLVQLAKCPQCSTASHFVTLLTLIVEKIAKGLTEVCCILADQNIDTNTTTFMDYGVDSAADFVTMYNAVGLPPLLKLREIVGELCTKSVDERWRVPYDNLQNSDQRLANIEARLTQMQ